MNTTTPRPELEKWYAENIAAFETFKKDLVSEINDLLTPGPGRGDWATGRVKGQESFITKATRVSANGEPKYSAPIEQIQDVVAIRVIVPMPQDLEAAKSALQSVFTFLEPLEEHNQRENIDQTRPGYRSHHGVIDVRGRSGPVNFVEIQLRTVLQHAWAELSHDMLYKGEKLEPHTERRLHALAGLLELADREFVDVQRSIAGFGGFQGPLIAAQLHAFSQNIFGNDDRIDMVWVDELIFRLQAKGIMTFEQLLDRVGAANLTEQRVLAPTIREQHGWVNSVILLESYLRTAMSPKTQQDDLGPVPYSMEWLTAKLSDSSVETALLDSRHD